MQDIRTHRNVSAAKDRSSSKYNLGTDWICYWIQPGGRDPQVDRFHCDNWLCLQQQMPPAGQTHISKISCTMQPNNCAVNFFVGSSIDIRGRGIGTAIVLNCIMWHHTCVYPSVLLILCCRLITSTAVINNLTTFMAIYSPETLIGVKR